jgi:gliding motility-associated-like protein
MPDQHKYFYKVPRKRISKFLRSLIFPGLFSILFFCKLTSYGQTCGVGGFDTTAFNLGGSGWRNPTLGTYNISAGALGMYIDFYRLDNSFLISVNGKQISDAEINFERPGGGFPSVATVFNDGSYYGNGSIPQVYSLSGNYLHPLLRIQIDASGNVTMFGAKSPAGTLVPMNLQTGNFNNVGALSINSSNLVTISQSALGPTLATGAAYAVADIPLLTADPARTICAGTSITLTANSGYGIWNVDPTTFGLNLSLTNVSPGVAKATFNASAKGLYKFVYTAGSCTVTDTVNVTEAIIPSFVLKQYPNPVCADSVVTIAIDSAVNTGTAPVFNWYVNNTLQQNAAGGSLTYLTKKGDVVTCEITGNGHCVIQQKVTDSLIVAFNTSKVLLPDTIKFCAGGSTVVTASTGFVDYLWQPTNQTSASITVSVPGKYSVTAKDPQGCPSSANVVVTNHALPSNILAFNEITKCPLGTARIFTQKPYVEYLWSTGSADSVIQAQNEGLYYLQVKDSNGCVGHDSAYVRHIQCSEFLYFPNAFTPNADALNDVFKPTYYGFIHSYELNVYDRWGNLIFTSGNPLLGWDGRVKGNMQAPATYVWYCRFKVNDYPERTLKGTVLLLR